jgi:hypothetical protein
MTLHVHVIGFSVGSAAESPALVARNACCFNRLGRRRRLEAGHGRQTAEDGLCTCEVAAFTKGGIPTVTAHRNPAHARVHFRRLCVFAGRETAR